MQDSTPLQRQWNMLMTLMSRRAGQLTNTNEIKSWALSFGPRATVLEPQSLRQEIANDLKQILANYRPAEKARKS